MNWINLDQGDIPEDNPYTELLVFNDFESYELAYYTEGEFFSFHDGESICPAPTHYCKIRELLGSPA